MNGVMKWWRGRRLAPRQQRYQEGHRYVVGPWRLQRITVGSWPAFTLVAIAASGQSATADADAIALLCKSPANG